MIRLSNSGAASAKQKRRLPWNEKPMVACFFGGSIGEIFVELEPVCG